MTRNQSKNKQRFQNNIYMKTPKFRRKLIEKYSTRRYNVNTKLVKKVPLCKQKQQILRPSKDNQQTTWKRSSSNDNISCALDQDRNVSDTANDAITNCLRTIIQSSEMDSRQSSTPDLDSKFNRNDSPWTEKCVSDDEKPESEVNALLRPPSYYDDIKSTDCSESSCLPGSTSQNANQSLEAAQSPNTLKRSVDDEESNDNKPSKIPKLIAANQFSELESNCNSNISSHTNEKPRSHTEPDFDGRKFSTTTFNFVPSKFYRYLTECANEPKAVAKPPIKKRKRLTMSKKKKKKANLSNQPKENIATVHDPYLDNWEELTMEKVSFEENIAQIVYLGVGRPLYPVIHRNIITLCQRNDTVITDMWAEFSLSTLTDNPNNHCVKPILMPVVDTQLLTAVMRFKEEWKVDFKKIEVTKMICPRLHVNAEVGNPAWKKKEAASKILESTAEPNEKVQICCQNLTGSNSDDALLVKENVPHLNSSIIFDEEYLLKRNFKPCWVLLKKVELNDLGNLVLVNQSNKSLDQATGKVAISSRTRRASSVPSQEAKVTSPQEKASGEGKSSNWRRLRRVSPNQPNCDSRVSTRNKPLNICLIGPSSRKKPSSFSRRRLILPSDELVSDLRKKPMPLDSKNSPVVLPAIPAPEHVRSSRLVDKKKLATQAPVSAPSKKFICDKKVVTVLSTSSVRTRRRAYLDCTTSTISSLSPVYAQKKYISTSCEKPDASLSIAKKPAPLAQMKSPISPSHIIHTSLRATKKPAVPEKKILHARTDTGNEGGLDQQKLPTEPSSSEENQPVNAKMAESTLVNAEVIRSSIDNYDDEWVLLEHYFGEKHCSRTYGPMIDYLSRNKSLIYFYKMRRILKLQRRNNRYFQSCYYLHIDKSVHPDCLIDILSETSDDYSTENGPGTLFNEVSASKVALETKGRSFRSISENPSEVMRFSKKSEVFGLAVLKDVESQNDCPLRFVDFHLFQNLFKTKWIILQLQQDVVEIVFNQLFEFSGKLLFEVMYRADLTKKIVCQTITAAKNDGSLELGVYGIPGLCDAVLLGPCRSPERHNSLLARIRVNADELEIVNIPIINNLKSTCVTDQSSKIQAVWWRPLNVPQQVTHINAAYLSFLFKCQTTSVPLSTQVDRLTAKSLMKKHNAKSAARYVGPDGDSNYTLFHQDGDEGFIGLPRQPPNYVGKRRAAIREVVRTSDNLKSQHRGHTHSEIAHDEPSTQDQKRELEKSWRFLNSVITGVKVIPSSSGIMLLLLKETLRTVRVLNKQYLGVLHKKETLLKRRKKLLSKFILQTRADGDDPLIQYRKRIFSMLALPRNAEKVEAEQSFLNKESSLSNRLQSSSHSGKGNQVCDMAVSPTTTTVENFKRGLHSAPLQDTIPLAMSKPVHVTVQSGNHIIGLGPYTEHNYCNFENMFQDPVDDPLEDGVVRNDVESYSYFTTTKNTDITSPSKDGVTDDPIHICITEDGKPIFKLTINRLKESKVEENKSCSSRLEIRPLIQRILHEMKCKLNEKSPGNGSVSMNHVQLLQNIISDTKNERMFHDIDEKKYTPKEELDHIVSFGSKNYRFQVQKSPTKLAHVNKLEKKHFSSTDGPVSKEEFFSECTDAENKMCEGRLVSINSLIDETIANQRKRNDSSHTNRNIASAQNSPHSFCISARSIENNELPATNGLERFVEEMYVEDDPSAEAIPGTSIVHSQMKPVQKNIISRIEPTVLHSVSSLPRVHYQELTKKHVPIILAKKATVLNQVKKPFTILIPRKNFAQLPRIQVTRPLIRCPSFVPTLNRSATESSIQLTKNAVSAGTSMNSPTLNTMENTSNSLIVPADPVIDSNKSPNVSNQESSIPSSGEIVENTTYCISNDVPSASNESGGLSRLAVKSTVDNESKSEQESNVQFNEEIVQDITDCNATVVSKPNHTNEPPLRLAVKSFASVTSFNYDRFLKF